jgi:hypothetical protein
VNERPTLMLKDDGLWLGWSHNGGWNLVLICDPPGEPDEPSPYAPLPLKKREEWR